MPAIAQYLAAARDLLIGDTDVANLSFYAGPQLAGDALNQFAEVARRTRRDTLYVHFGQRIDDGPLGFQLLMPRANAVIISPLGELWAPFTDSQCALVGAQDHSGYQIFADGELGFQLGSLAADLRPGIRRGRKRLIERARTIRRDRTSNYSRVELRW